MNINIDHNSEKPLHMQAEELVRKLIEQEEYKNGKLLPNEVDLSKQLNISRNTLRQALNKLVFEGLLIRKKGFGTTVAKKSVFSGAKNWLSFSQEMKALGVEVFNFELHASYRRAPEEVCEFFQVPHGSRLFCLERLRGKKEFPFVYFVSYFNPSIPLSSDENYTRPLYEILEDDFHIEVKTSQEEISAKLPDDCIAEKLEIDSSDPILIRKRFVFDINNTPVEYNIGYYRGDSFVYQIESTRE